MGSNEVSSMMERVYGRAQHIGKREGFRKCKGSCGWVWKKNECRSKITRKVRYGRGKRL